MIEIVNNDNRDFAYDIKPFEVELFDKIKDQIQYLKKMANELKSPYESIRLKIDIDGDFKTLHVFSNYINKDTIKYYAYITSLPKEKQVNGYDIDIQLYMQYIDSRYSYKIDSDDDANTCLIEPDNDLIYSVENGKLSEYCKSVSIHPKAREYTKDFFSKYTDLVKVLFNSEKFIGIRIDSDECKNLDYEFKIDRYYNNSVVVTLHWWEDENSDFSTEITMQTPDDIPTINDLESRF